MLVIWNTIKRVWDTAESCRRTVHPEWRVPFFCGFQPWPVSFGSPSLPASASGCSLYFRRKCDTAGDIVCNKTGELWDGCV